MLSNIFLKDYKAMTAAGVKFTPGDIVRLNALAIKAKLARKPLGALHYPRAAIMPRTSPWQIPLVLREPTLAHEMWIERMESCLDISAGQINSLVLYAFALSRRAGRLPDPDKPKKAIKRIFRFARKNAALFTRRELSDAVDYCRFGADWTAGELPPPRPDGESDARGSIALATIAAGIVYRLPLTLDEAKRLTASQIMELIARVDLHDGGFDADKAHHNAFGDYIRARDEIAARSNAARGESET